MTNTGLCVATELLADGKSMSNYLEYWQLDHSPFRGPLTPYPSPALNEAVARIEWIVESPATVAAIIGDAGSGKTVALCSMIDRLKAKPTTAIYVDAIATSSRELLSQLACQLGIASVASDDTPRLWRKLGDGLAQQPWQQRRLILLVDNAGDSVADLLNAIQRILQLAAASKTDVTIALAASAKQATRWPSGLREAVELRVDMYAWNEMTTLDYLQHAAIDAGRTTPLFTEDAMFRLHELSGGVPRQISRLAELALVAGAATELPLIDSSCVADTSRELACVI